MSNTTEDKLISVEAGIKEIVDSVIGDMKPSEILIVADINTLSSLVIAGVSTDSQKESLLTHYRANPESSTDPLEVANNWEERRESLLALLKSLNSLSGLFKAKIDVIDNINIVEHLDNLEPTGESISALVSKLSALE